MSLRNNHSFEAQNTNLLHAETVYNNNALLSVKHDLVEVTDKQLHTLEQLDHVGGLELKESSSYYALTTGDLSMSKQLILSAQLPGSPLRENNQASQKRMECIHVLDIMQYLIGDEELNAVFITCSFENADMGQLCDNLQAQNLAQKKFLRAMKRSKTIWGGMQFKGAIPRDEITVNRKHLLDMDPHNLFHQHLHILVFVTGEEQTGQLYRRLWKLWADICEEIGLRTSPAAFLVETTYEKKSEKYIMKQGPAYDKRKEKKKKIMAGMLEANKYETKPSDLAMLEVKKKDELSPLDWFKLRTWAEIYNARVHPKLSDKCQFKGIKEAKMIRMRPVGLYQKAGQIYKAIIGAGLGGVLDFKKCEGNLARIPSVFTRAVLVDIKRIIQETKAEVIKYKGSGYRYVAKVSAKLALSDFEVGYYNKQILRNTLFLSGLDGFKHAIAKSRYDLAEKSRVVVDVLEHLGAWNKSAEEIDEVLDEWIETILNYVDEKGNYNQDKVRDIQMLKAAYHTALTNDGYKQLRARFMAYSSNNFAQADDDITLTENGHVVLGDFDYAVRSFKQLDLAKKIEKQAKGDGMLETLYSSGQLQAFYREALKGKANLRRRGVGEQFQWVIDTVRNYVPLFVGLRTGLKMKNETESKFAYPVNTWEFWEEASDAMESKLTGLTPQLTLLLACLLYAMNGEKYREAVMCMGSAARTVNVSVDDITLRHMVDHLLKKNQTNNNPLFKPVKTEKKVAA